MDATRFSSLREKLFPGNDIIIISTCASMYYRSNDTFCDFLAHSVQTFWSLICLPATRVARAGVTGRLYVCTGVLTKNPLICSVSKFNLGGLEIFLVGAKPTKFPVVTELVTKRRLFQKLFYRTMPNSSK